jgi:hypothetical protein
MLSPKLVSAAVDTNLKEFSSQLAKLTVFGTTFYTLCVEIAKGKANICNQ